MKTLLIAEYRDGKLLENYAELLGFSQSLDADTVMFLVGSPTDLPKFPGKLYLADAGKYGEYNPACHKRFIEKVVAAENPDIIVLSHSSYGWDLAPRLSCALQIPQISEVVDVIDGLPVVPLCNAKMRRTVKPLHNRYVITLQAGAYTVELDSNAAPEVTVIDDELTENIIFQGYEEAQKGGVDLSKAEIIVSAGRGVGKPENVKIIADLAARLGGEYGASRPVVDAEWVEHNRQVGTTGQTVSPKLYVACGISGAIQHLAGMKKSEFVVAINTDRDAPISEIADILVIADLKQFIPALMEKL
ncbi:MAG: electron transfer flavoprotein subunit alpha/FixB family protein [Desulfopila sp.]|jgi:electron transfer flavoprotein alpha subunit|nr:electron transfer flavoprotein subunit alpha/FixB family protein [Desulfopila sp.]